MSDPRDLSETSGRIAVIREQIRIATEQAAAETGGAVEERLSERIAELETELNELQNRPELPA